MFARIIKQDKISNYLFFALVAWFFLEASLFNYKIYKPPHFMFWVAVNLGMISFASAIFGRKLGCALLLVCFVILSIISNEKFSNTSEYIGYFDLISTENFTVAIKYFEIWHWGVIILLFGLFIFVIRKINFPTTWRQRRTLLVVSMVSVMLSYPGYLKLKEYYPEWLTEYLDSYNYFFAWNWSTNIKRNGIVNHLYMTYDIKVPEKNRQEQEALEKQFAHHASQKITPHLGNVIFIKCESCWDVKGGVGLHDGLEKQGFQSFELWSPTYGAGTANAGFEMLTAMPSKAGLTGIIYQGYADLMRDDVESLPKMMRAYEYHAAGFHNYYDFMWRRKKVMPKMGFETFDGIDKMMEGEFSGFPRDTVLYDYVLKYFSERYTHQNNFLYMITVHSHGPYEGLSDPEGNYGMENYKKRMKIVEEDLFKFLSSLKKMDPSINIFIFADHKPNLTKFYKKEGFFSSEKFSEMDWSMIGSVGGYYYGKNADTLVQSANKKPHFCFPYYFSKEILGVINQPMKFLELHGTCEKKKYNDFVDGYPDWMYSSYLLQ